MVALNKDWPFIAFFDSCGNEGSAKFSRLLIGIAHLAARNFKDERTRLGSLGSAESRANRIIGGKAHIHGGNRTVTPFILCTGHVKVVDASWACAQLLADLPDQPARIFSDRLGTKYCIAYQ